MCGWYNLYYRKLDLFGGDMHICIYTQTCIWFRICNIPNIAIIRELGIELIRNLR